MDTQKRKVQEKNYTCISSDRRQLWNKGIWFHSQYPKLNPGSSNGSGNIISSNFGLPTSGFYWAENCMDFPPGHCNIIDGLPACFQNDFKDFNQIQSSAVKFHLQDHQIPNFSAKSHLDCYRNSAGTVLSFMQKPAEESESTLMNQRQNYVSFSEYQNHQVSSKKILVSVNLSISANIYI